MQNKGLGYVYATCWLTFKQQKSNKKGYYNAIINFILS